jgi:hypothetical protein
VYLRKKVHVLTLVSAEKGLRGLFKERGILLNGIGGEKEFSISVRFDALSSSASGHRRRFIGLA